MKITAMTIVALAAGMVAQAAQPPQTLTVYVRYPIAVAFQALQAQALAKQMFATIGIGLQWRRGEPAPNNPTGAIAIELVDHHLLGAAKRRHPGDPP